VYEQKQWQGTELFRQPLVSFIYERGWRQNFAGAGFPGPEKEFDQAMQYLAPAEGGILVDASCGTGLFTRLFARSQRYKGVVALDFRWGRLVFHLLQRCKVLCMQALCTHAHVLMRCGRGRRLTWCAVCCVFCSESMLRQAQQYFSEDAALRSR
jgi:hypothetical protein